MFWVYILQSPSGHFYLGHTDHLQSRLQSHNRADRVLGKFTRKYGAWQLVWMEEHSTRSLAVAREHQIKPMKSARWIREHPLKGRIPPGRG